MSFGGDTSEVPKEEQCSQKAIDDKPSNVATYHDDGSCRDPMMSGMDATNNLSPDDSPVLRCEDSDETSPVDLDGREDSISVLSKNFVGDGGSMAMNAMFPELHPVVEEDFDFCE